MFFYKHHFKNKFFGYLQTLTDEMLKYNKSRCQ